MGVDVVSVVAYSNSNGGSISGLGACVMGSRLSGWLSPI